MCGIVGYVGRKKVVPVIIEGLRRLEYRGYDSAGIAVGSPNTALLEVCRAPASWATLEEVLREHPLDGTFGIGHTAGLLTAVPPKKTRNPHRDCTGRIVVVHNGIVENYLDLKRELTAQGHKFVTETDTEIIAHLIEQIQNEATAAGTPILLEDAIRRAVKRLTGAFALGILSSAEPDKIIAARSGPPVVIGVGEGEYFVASDVPGILHHTRNIYFLADGDMAILTLEGVKLTDLNGKAHRARNSSAIHWDPIQAEKAATNISCSREIWESQWMRWSSRSMGLPFKSVSLTPSRSEDGHVTVGEEVNVAGVVEIPGTSEATKYSPSPTPITTGGPERAAMILSGSAEERMRERRHR